MSGLLGNIFGGGASSGIADILVRILGSQGGTGGGLATIVQRLEAAGLGEHVQSWIGSGPNMPLSPENVANALPPEQVEQWAQQAGTSKQQLLQVLSEAIPQVVDHATPNGQVPAGGLQSADLAGLLGRFLSR